jgi:hypothetical protein
MNRRPLIALAALLCTLTAVLPRPNAAHGQGSGGTVPITPEEVVRGVGTRSYAATMDEVTRAEFLGRVRALLATHPDTRGRAVVELPYTTRAYRLTPR